MKCMKIAMIASESLAAEFLKGTLPAGVTHVESVDALNDTSGWDALIDLDFDHSSSRIEQLKSTRIPLVIIHSILQTCQELPQGFVRILAWPGFINGSSLEAACDDKKLRENAADVLAVFGRSLNWVKDVPGFLSPRVVSSIINEAYYGIAENLSSRDEIDTAMKLGTNYPHGPFEWAELIGKEKIAQLLFLLNKIDHRYAPAPLLVKEVTD